MGMEPVPGEGSGAAAGSPSMSDLPRPPLACVSSGPRCVELPGPLAARRAALPRDDSGLVWRPAFPGTRSLHFYLLSFAITWETGASATAGWVEMGYLQLDMLFRKVLSTR